ncbi:ATP-dependent zinc protease [Thiocapsa imhoffii]|uniref:ATP-dependent zinc protease n=1 Tax=Thiocapsa imhoffii TaxID=382777 RepID=A0A9X1BBM1_9GAMM|nr:ATP-dependent zinc protease [Thiocapsa imhoffii]MBK1646731.1 ATP-dependent zinc protease [Thiocapsa imhoffii]
MARSPQPESRDPPMLLGWREWIALPELGLNVMKAKIDTGARTSTLHAFYVDRFQHDGATHVRFGIHPLQNRTDLVVHAQALVVDERSVTDSGGHREDRLVIRTPLVLGGVSWPIEVTLTNRESMLFRMLIGRTALAGRARVDPARSFLTGRVEQPASQYPRSARIGPPER